MMTIYKKFETIQKVRRPLLDLVEHSYQRIADERQEMVNTYLVLNQYILQIYRVHKVQNC